MILSFSKANRLVLNSDMIQSNSPKWHTSGSVFNLCVYVKTSPSQNAHKSKHPRIGRNVPIKTSPNNYEGWSKSSDLYLVALYRDIFEGHTMHHSNERVFTFIMMLIFSSCTVSFNNYSTLFMAHSNPLACLHVIEL